MTTKNKIITLTLLSASATVGTIILNKIIKLKATSKNFLKNHNEKPISYNWRFGNINYKKSGNGQPLLLIHDLDSTSNNYEWNKIIDDLSKEYTVYAPDLIGCGNSEKPDMTYTNFLYVQMINDFILSEIKHRTKVIVTGDSAPLIIMACRANPDLYDKIIFISPQSPDDGLKYPGKKAKTYKFILNLPIIGTLLYNIASSKATITQKISNNNCLDLNNLPADFIDTYFESAHFGTSPKSLYASSICNYTKCNFIPALAESNHSMFIINGSFDSQGDMIADKYQSINPSIEVSTIKHSGRLPQLSEPVELLKTVSIYLN